MPIEESGPTLLCTREAHQDRTFMIKGPAPAGHTVYVNINTAPCSRLCSSTGTLRSTWGWPRRCPLLHASRTRKYSTRKYTRAGGLFAL